MLLLVYANVQSRLQGTRNTRPCISGHPVSNPWITSVYKCIVYCVLYTIRFNLTKHSLINLLCQVARHYTHGDIDIPINTQLGPFFIFVSNRSCVQSFENHNLLLSSITPTANHDINSFLLLSRWS